ncbi:MAG: peptidylprolyl isomerase [Proteobacteria bacterium]|nr:peptidylprolyl isomerase [Burkholderiales bacterium]
MQITENTVVSLRYRLFDDADAMIEDAQEIDYLHGGFEQIFEDVEAALEGKTVGDAVLIDLPPERAFGEIDPDLTRTDPRSSFPAEVKVGMQFEGTAPDGKHDVVYRVIALDDDTVTVDGNHPLAGRALRFDCTVLGVRRASRDEVTHGHAHGAHGHHH